MTILRAALSLAAVCITVAFGIIPGKAALADDVAILASGNYGQAATTAEGFKIAADSTGQRFVTGQFEGTSITFGSQSASRVGTDRNGFVTRLDATGTPTSVSTIGGTGNPTVRPQAIAIGSTGQYFVAGYFSGADLSAPTAVSLNGTRNGFVIKYNSLNNMIWAKAIGGSGTVTQVTGIAVDGSGDVYVTGNFGGGSLTGTLTLALSNANSTDGFVAKLNGLDGTQLWVQSIAGAGGSVTDVVPTAVAVDGSNRAYVGGYFDIANLVTPALNRIGGAQTGFMLRYTSSGSNN